MFWNYNIPWEQQRIVIEKITNVTASHLRAQKSKGVYNNNVDAVIDLLEKPDEVVTEVDVKEEKYPHMKEVTGLEGTFSDGTSTATLLQADCYFDIDQDGFEELCIITVSLNKTDDSKNPTAALIRMDLNDCDLQDFPVLFAAWDELEDMSLGVGVCQVGEKDQLSLNTHTRQLMDNISEINNPTKLIDKGLLKEGQNLDRWHDKVLEFDGDPNTAIFYDRPPSIANEILAAINMDKANIQNGTRASVSFQGLAARYDTTATEYTQGALAASRGIMAQIKNFEDAILKPFLKFQYSYNLQKLTRNNIITILGRQAALAVLGETNQKSVSEVIRGDYDFIPLGVTQTENKIIRGQQLLNALNVAMKINMTNPGMIPLDMLWNKFWDTAGDGDNKVYAKDLSDESMFLPEDENILIAQGADLQVNPLEDDAEHAQIHIGVMNEIAPEFQAMMQKHLKRHDLQAQKKIMQQQMAQIQQALAGATMKGAGARQQPNFGSKPPIPGNNGGVPGVVEPPVGTM